jgi:hypothetical protein
MIVVGVVQMFFDKFPLPEELPGDIHIRKAHTEFTFPVLTSIVLSLLMSGINGLISTLGAK